MEEQLIVQNFDSVIGNQVLLTAQTINQKSSNHIFTEKEIEGSLKLARILSDIHNDMKKEGYDIIEGKVFFGGIQVFKPVTPKEKFY